MRPLAGPRLSGFSSKQCGCRRPTLRKQQFILRTTPCCTLLPLFLLDRTKQAPKTHAALIGQFSQLVQGEDQGRRFGRAFSLAEKLRLVVDYDDQKVPTAEEAAQLRAIAIDFVAYCRSLL